MAKTALITARIDPDLKRETKKVLDEIGLTTTQAITLFFKQIAMRKGLPFAVAIPNAETAEAIEKALAGVDRHAAESVDNLFEKMAG
jgi:DNA-damage-inducible protein J